MAQDDGFAKKVDQIRVRMNERHRDLETKEALATKAAGKATASSEFGWVKLDLVTFWSWAFLVGIGCLFQRGGEMYFSTLFVDLLESWVDSRKCFFLFKFWPWILDSNEYNS